MIGVHLTLSAAKNSFWMVHVEVKASHFLLKTINTPVYVQYRARWVGTDRACRGSWAPCPSSLSESGSRPAARRDSGGQRAAPRSASRTGSSGAAAPLPSPRVPPGPRCSVCTSDTAPGRSLSHWLRTSLSAPRSAGPTERGRGVRGCKRFRVHSYLHNLRSLNTATSLRTNARPSRAQHPTNYPLTEIKRGFSDFQHRFQPKFSRKDVNRFLWK